MASQENQNLVGNHAETNREHAGTLPEIWPVILPTTSEQLAGNNLETSWKVATKLAGNKLENQRKLAGN